MAIPAWARAEGEVLDIKAEVSASSESSSVARRTSWVCAKEGIERGFRGSIFGLGLGRCGVVWCGVESRRRERREWSVM